MPFPYDVPTTVGFADGGGVMPAVTGEDVRTAVELLQEIGLTPVVTGSSDPASVVVSQRPLPGEFVSPGSEVHLITSPPGGSPRTTPRTVPSAPTSTP